MTFAEELKEVEQTIINHKKTEYTTGKDEDRFQNFEEVAKLTGTSREDVALMYLLKHIQSIALAVRQRNFKWYWFDESCNEGLKQRFADARNYLLLLGEAIDNTVKKEKQEETQNDLVGNR